MYLLMVGEDIIIMDNTTVMEVKLESDTTVVIFTILSTFLCAISAFLNITTMIIVIYLPKQTPFSKLFINLAICDTLGTVAIYIGDGFYRAGIHWNLLSLERLNSIFIVAGICFNLLFLTSTVTLLVFAIMRFIAIKKPHLFKSYFVSSKRILIYICLCWIISTFVALPSIICEYSPKKKCGTFFKDNQNVSFSDSNLNQYNDRRLLDNSNVTIESVNSMNISLYDATRGTPVLSGSSFNTSDTGRHNPQPCLTELAYSVCYHWKYTWAGGKALILIIVVLLYVHVSKDLLKRSGSFRENDDSVRKRAHDLRAFITIIILTVSLVLLGVPYIVVRVYRRAVFDQTTIDVYQHCIIYFPYINFILDPLVYSIRSPDIYDKYKSIIERIICHIRGQEPRGNGYGVISMNNGETVTQTIPNNHGPTKEDVV
ncbi:unnamed protein product [Owenia fusiformis]|uniref:Uncharacterized protein n=1 Tax=Owenia fusiformis TaxID=6347 RepID=A0A8J1Y1H9_OWEFU|nr:unnamed protein product [Owenia fusiformis]